MVRVMVRAVIPLSISNKKVRRVAKGWREMDSILEERNPDQKWLKVGVQIFSVNIWKGGVKDSIWMGQVLLVI